MIEKHTQSQAPIPNPGTAQGAVPIKDFQQFCLAKPASRAAGNLSGARSSFFRSLRGWSQMRSIFSALSHC